MKYLFIFVYFICANFGLSFLGDPKGLPKSGGQKTKNFLVLTSEQK